MLAPLLAHLADLPHDPEIEPRAWHLHCSAPCGCREQLGEVHVDDAAAHRWVVWLDDHYQPTTPSRDRWIRVPRIRHAKRQPWATGSGIAPAPAVPDGTRQPVEVSDMRQWEAGRPRPAGHLVGPLGVGRTPGDVLIVCPFGHQNHVTIEQIETEVARLAELHPVLN